MANRSVTRGTNAVFEELFLEADSTPIIPGDPLSYPQVSISDPTGTVLATGIGVLISEGRYRFTWFTPLDAELTSCDPLYKITWTIITGNNRQIQRELEFSVIDQIDINPTERAFTYLTMFGKQERLFIRFRCPPQELTLTLVAPNGTRIVVPLGSLNSVSDQGQVVYYYDTPELGMVGCYIAMWDSRQTTISPRVTSVQTLRVPEDIFFSLAPSLRMLIDKAQKKIGLVQAYSDPDMYEYLQRGIGMVNAENPITSWGMSSFPSAFGFTEFVLLASGYWALQAQYLSEGEIGSFSFGGQTVTLDVDRTGIYEGMMSRFQDYLDKNLQKTKRNWLRRMSVGQYAGRSYDFGLTSLVTRVQFVNGGNGQLLPLLSRIGII